MKVIGGRHLTYGATKSCGCLNKETISKRAKTHGLTETVEYRTWRGMKTRCYNSNERSWANYGQRGIVLCDQWKESFETFFRDMGPRPGPGYSIERRDPNGPYSPENCLWIPMAEQCNNKRRTVWVTALGKTMTMAQWAKHTGIHRATIEQRLARGWSAELALTAPLYSIRHETPPQGNATHAPAV